MPLVAESMAGIEACDWCRCVWHSQDMTTADGQTLCPGCWWLWQGKGRLTCPTCGHKCLVRHGTTNCCGTVPVFPARPA